MTVADILGSALGQLRVTWIHWCLLALVTLDLYLLGRWLIAAPAPDRAAGRWASSALSPTRIRASTRLSLLIALGYLLPAAWRFLLQVPRFRSPRENGTVIGSLIGSGLQVLLMLSGLTRIALQSACPLRPSTHLTEATP